MRYLSRWFSGAVDVPRHATAVANGALVGVALLYGAIAGGHVPQVVQASATVVGFGIRDLSLSGQRETSEMAIAAALELDSWSSLIGYDVEAARQRLEALPWIASASVRKAYPGGLVVTVVERTPVAVWQHDNDLSLIDGKGKVITDLADPRFAALPLVIGVGADAAAGEILPLVQAAPQLASRVTAHIRIAERRWDLRLDNGVTVRLPEAGAGEALAELERLEAEGGLLERDIAAVDLRIADRIGFELTPSGAAARAQTVKDAIAAEKKGRHT